MKFESISNVDSFNSDESSVSFSLSLISVKQVLGEPVMLKKIIVNTLSAFECVYQKKIIVYNPKAMFSFNRTKTFFDNSGQNNRSIRLNE